MKVCILGAGNVASHLARAFCGAGHDVSVWNRSESALREFQSLGLGVSCTIRMEDLVKDADVYLISVKDDAVETVAKQLKDVLGQSDAIVAHTAGSLSLDIVAILFQHAGVLYPMQTFSKQKALDYSKIPFFVEAKGDELSTLVRLAQSVSPSVYELDSEKRRYLHLASVFACNFVNHCFVLSQEILNEIGLPFQTMLPLVEETIDKLKTLSPSLAQTGPAVRQDFGVMEKQMALLKDTPELQEIYRQLSQSIIRTKKQTPKQTNP